MKNQKNGFTLVELLAVIVVLAIILAVAVPKIVKLIDNAKAAVYVTNEQMMVSSVKKFILKNDDYIPEVIGEKNFIPLSEIISQNYMEEIVDPKDKSEYCSGHVQIEKTAANFYKYDPFLECGTNHTTYIDENYVVSDTTPADLRGQGTLEDPYLIESIEDLVSFGKNVDTNVDNYWENYVKLITDLDFKNPYSYNDSNNTILFGDVNGDGNTEGILLELTTGKGFDPIGNDTTEYSGRLFDGNDHIIRNLYINRPIAPNIWWEPIGLFHAVWQWTGYDIRIENLNLMDVNITGGAQTGGIVGAGSGSITNVSVAGSIIGGYGTGGIIGSNEQGYITNCFSKGTISGTDLVGGLIGENGYNDEHFARIDNSYSTADVTGDQYVGGLVGQNYAIIENSYSTGDVTSDRYAAGIAGKNYVTINNSYSSGTITGTTEYTAGIAGRNYATGFITNSYTTSDILGTYVVSPGVGASVVGSTSTNSYYYEGAVCTGEDCEVVTPITAETLINLKLSSWHTGTLGWDQEWKVKDSYYPKLYKKGTSVLLNGQNDTLIP